MLSSLPPGIHRTLGAFSSDARHYQLSFLFIFLLTGLFALNWSLLPWQIPLTFLVALLTQFGGIHLLKLPLHSLKSALITSFSLCLLFRSESYAVILLATFLSIASKFVFRINGKHFFNPANFGICATILLTGKGWISPGQWGSEGLWLFLVGILGFLVVSRAQRLDLALSFIVGFGGAMLVRMVFWQHWPLDALLHLFTSGSLLLFTFFMITDPASTPAHKTVRICWAFAAGLLAFYLQAYQWINASPLWALFFLSPLSPLLDHFFKGEKFRWTRPEVLSQHLSTSYPGQGLSGTH
ncbi:MAG: RnfABCDGE type electron transport complex subunit D [Bacteroidia bacterium]|nr:RnfABCDGE type electron transport complex subunit D [Bacteroidia bacterium]